MSKTLLGDGRELECALDDMIGNGLTVQSCSKKQFIRKNFVKVIKFSDSLKSTQNSAKL